MTDQPNTLETKTNLELVQTMLDQISAAIKLALEASQKALEQVDKLETLAKEIASQAGLAIVLAEAHARPLSELELEAGIAKTEALIIIGSPSTLYCPKCGSSNVVDDHFANHAKCLDCDWSGSSSELLL